MPLQQGAPELRLIQRAGVLEEHLQVRRQRVAAFGHDEVVQVTDRDDVVDDQGVPALRQQLRHHLQTGAFTLHHRRQPDQRVDQRRAEWIHLRELRLTSWQVTGQQHVVGTGITFDRHDGLLDALRGGLVARLQQPAVRDLRQVRRHQFDGVEAVLPPPERLPDRHPLGTPGHRCPLPEELLQVALPGHERHDRDRPAGGSLNTHPLLDQFRDLRPLDGHEVAVGQVRGQPQHELVEEQHQPVVAEALRVRAHRGQTGRDVQPLTGRAVAGEHGRGQVGDQPVTIRITDGRRGRSPHTGLVPATSEVAPTVIPTSAIERGEEGLGTVLHAGQRIVEQQVAAMQHRRRRARVPLVDGVQVPGEQGVLQRRRPDQVVLDGQQARVQDVAVFADRLLQSRQCPRRW